MFLCFETQSCDAGCPAAAVEDEEEEGSGRVVGGCTGPSTGGAVWRKRAAAVEALVR